MRRSAVWFLLAVLLLVASTGCGGGGSSKVGPPASITTSPTSLSLQLGQVAAISAAVVDAKGNAVSNPAAITFASSNPAVATVTSAGAVCAGTWGSNNIVCTPGQVGPATITVTSGTVSATVSVFAHLHVDRLVISPASVGLAECKSQGQTQQMTAQALSNGADITSTVGPITWTSSVTKVATVDSNGLVTTVAPGATIITASAAATNSPPAGFITCPVQTIRIHVSGAAGTSFSFATGATQQLQADVLDSAGLAVSVTPTWASSQPVVAGVNSTGLATAGQPGAATITATCGATCNIGLPPVFSNTVLASVPGNSANVVFAAGTGSTSLVPIDTTTNTAGTAITLSAQPNSLLVNPAGTTVFLGSGAGLMSVTAATNAVANDTSHPGTVLAISPDGTWVAVAGASTLFLVNTSTSSSTQTLNIAGATSAAFTPDSAKVFIAAGNNVWAVIPGGSATALPQSATVASASMLASGAFAYFGSAANNVFALASCNNAPADTPLATASAPSLLAALPDGSSVVAVDSLGINVIPVTITASGCPPVMSDTINTTAFASAVTPRQILVLPNSSQAYVTTDAGLLGFTLTAGAATPISPTPLFAAAAFTGGATLDSKSVYVGASDNAVHRIDTTAGADVQQIPLSFAPDLVAVRPK